MIRKKKLSRPMASVSKMKALAIQHDREPGAVAKDQAEAAAWAKRHGKKILPRANLRDALPDNSRFSGLKSVIQQPQKENGCRAEAKDPEQRDRRNRPNSPCLIF